MKAKKLLMSTLALTMGLGMGLGTVSQVTNQPLMTPAHAVSENQRAKPNINFSTAIKSVSINTHKIYKGELYPTITVYISDELCKSIESGEVDNYGIKILMRGKHHGRAYEDSGDYDKNKKALVTDAPFLGEFDFDEYKADDFYLSNIVYGLNQEFKLPASAKNVYFTAVNSPKPTSKPDSKPKPKPAPKPSEKPAPKPAPKPTPKPNEKPNEKPAPKPEEKPVEKEEISQQVEQVSPEKAPIVDVTEIMEKNKMTEKEINKLDENTTVTIKKEESQDKWEGKGELRVASHAEVENFVKVQVDGKDVAPSHYIVRKGSTIIEFKEAFLKTLSSGDHKVSIVSTTGIASTEVKLSKTDKQKSNTTLYATTGALVSVALVSAFVIIKKKSK